jgi:hypothetical protein
MAAPGLSKLNSMQARAKRANPDPVDVSGRAPSRSSRARTLTTRSHRSAIGGFGLPRKEVIQPHLPVRLPCYDFTPIAGPTFDGSLPCGLGHRLRVLPTFVV